MGFIGRVSNRRQLTHRTTASSGAQIGGGADSRAATRVRSGLTSSRNPERRGPRVQEAIGLLSWGALSFAATLFVRMDNPREVFVAWALAILLVTWIVTAVASRRVRQLPVRNRSQSSGRHQ